MLMESARLLHLIGDDDSPSTRNSSEAVGALSRLCLCNRIVHPGRSHWYNPISVPFLTVQTQIESAIFGVGIATSILTSLLSRVVGETLSPIGWSSQTLQLSTLGTIPKHQQQLTDSRWHCTHKNVLQVIAALAALNLKITDQTTQAGCLRDCL